LRISDKLKPWNPVCVARWSSFSCCVIVVLRYPSSDLTKTQSLAYLALLSVFERFCFFNSVRCCFLAISSGKILNTKQQTNNTQQQRELNTRKNRNSIPHNQQQSPRTTTNIRPKPNNETPGRSRNNDVSSCLKTRM
jgi:hypothetical protein